MSIRTIDSTVALERDPGTTAPAPKIADTPLLFVPDRVPDCEILTELGRGATSIVYKARHTVLNRIVAVKLLTTGAGELVTARCRKEAEAITAVRHPNVVTIYRTGEVAGRSYLVLEYLPGGSVRQLLASGQRAHPRAAAALIVAVARGVADAHARGIVHRDLKPANILLDSCGNPKVADFGLAKLCDGTTLTAQNAVMGTPAYMAPEQARGNTRCAGPPADVWALGVILYEFLTGGRPFVGTALDLIGQILSADPVPPGALVPGLPCDLERICLKCLEKDPADRYPTAKELADDLDRFGRGAPISARPPGPLTRGYKWIKRHALASALITGAALTLAAGCAVAFCCGLEAGRQTAPPHEKHAPSHP
jgi:serine/threonine protein kinase